MSSDTIQDQMIPFEDHLQERVAGLLPSLAEPMVHTLESGGKRIRPALVLAMGTALQQQQQELLDLAAAVEIFHNFSLVHDDIMDDAPLRRGRETAYKKYGIDRAILTGDAYLIYCYQLLESYQPRECYPHLVRAFSHMAMQVCVGQQMDMDFEKEQEVTLDRYLQMITGKTASLLGFCLQGAAYLAEASTATIQQAYDLGMQMGLAFQILDDYLDLYSESPKLGKQIGGDILQRKKNILYVCALRSLSGGAKQEFMELYHTDAQDKIQQVRAIYSDLGVQDQVEMLLKDYRGKVTQSVNHLTSVADMTSVQNIIEQLSGREY